MNIKRRECQECKYSFRFYIDGNTAKLPGGRQIDPDHPTCPECGSDNIGQQPDHGYIKNISCPYFGNGRDGCEGCMYAGDISYFDDGSCICDCDWKGQEGLEEFI